jgi:hypothetical protein
MSNALTKCFVNTTPVTPFRNEQKEILVKLEYIDYDLPIGYEE